MLSRVLLCISLGFVCVSAVLAEGSSRLQEIEQQVERETRQLARLQLQVRGLESDLETAEKVIASLKDRERNTGKELDRVMKERDALANDLVGLKKEAAEIAGLSGARLRALYMSRGNRKAQPDLAVLGESKVQKISYYSQIVQRHDRTMLKKLAIAGKRIEAKTAALSELVENQDKLKASIVSQRKKIAARVVQQRKVISEIKQQREKLNEVLTGLRAQALRLETVVASLTEGRGPDFYRKQMTPAPEKPAVRSFEGKGLDALKSELLLPVPKSRVLKRFGKQKLSGFKDIIFSKGMELLVSAEVDVKVIAPGRVLFAGTMPGYGKILIVDHGKRTYSLYGQLHAQEVRKGQVLRKGDVIAIAGRNESDNSGRLYFEIRKNGKPVDPVKYFGKRLG